MNNMEWVNTSRRLLKSSYSIFDTYMKSSEKTIDDYKNKEERINSIYNKKIFKSGCDHNNYIDNLKKYKEENIIKKERLLKKNTVEKINKQFENENIDFNEMKKIESIDEVINIENKKSFEINSKIILKIGALSFLGLFLYSFLSIFIMIFFNIIDIFKNNEADGSIKSLYFILIFLLPFIILTKGLIGFSKGRSHDDFKKTDFYLFILSGMIAIFIICLSHFAMYNSSILLMFSVFFIYITINIGVFLFIWYFKKIHNDKVKYCILSIESRKKYYYDEFHKYTEKEKNRLNVKIVEAEEKLKKRQNIIKEKNINAIHNNKNKTKKRLKEISLEFISELEDIEKIVNNIERKIKNNYIDWHDEKLKTFDCKKLQPIVPLGQLRKICRTYDHNKNHIYFDQLKRKYQKNSVNYIVLVPAFIQLIGNKSFLLKFSQSPTSPELSQIQTLILRILTNIPAGKLKFLLIDSVGRGQKVAPFLHLKDYKLDESSNENLLIGSRAWTEERDIQTRLEDITRHMEDVIQDYLRNEFENIEAFNQHAGEVTEPYRVIVIMDFPAGFNQESARRLLSILQGGARCGVYAVIVTNPAYPLPRDFRLQDLEQLATVINCKEGSFSWSDPDYKDCELILEKPPETKIFNGIVDRVGQAAVKAHKQVEVPFEKILQYSQLTQEKWWTGNSADKISVPLGPIGATKMQCLDLGKGTAQHILTAGKTGSGKSTLLHVLITTLALKYSPDDIQLYLIDFKKGVEFKRYASMRLPHARVIAIESEREFGLNVLEGLDAELKRRGDLFRKAEVDNLKTYCQKHNKIPRILLLVDEFQEFFTETDPIASKSGQILDRLVRQGRAFGLHIILGSQTLGGSYSLARTTIDQMAIRIALQCSEQDSRLILHDDNNAARRLSRAGQAIYNANNGLVEGNSLFQVAWLSDKQQDDYLKEIQNLARKKGCFPPKLQTIFEGNKLTAIEQHEGLKDLLSKPINKTPTKPVFAWLGDPVAIKDITAIRFRRQTANNLMIVGKNRDMGMSLLMTMMLSLSTQYPKQSLLFYCLDFSEADSDYANYFHILSQSKRQKIKLGRHRQFTFFVSEINQEIERRLTLIDEVDTLKSMPLIFFVIYGIQRVRDLNQDAYREYGFGANNDAPPNPAKQFAQILKEGSDLGIHTILWCDTANNLNRRLERQAIREFDLRILLQMSKEDASPLVDTPNAVAKLGENRALLFDVQEGLSEKLRPFSLSGKNTSDWLRKYS